MSSPSGPTAEIFALTSGYILRVGERTVACTSLGALATALKSELARPNQDDPIPFPPRPTVSQVRAAFTPAPPEPPVLSPGVQDATRALLATSLGALPEDQLRAFYQIGHAFSTGQLPNKASAMLNIEKYVPDLDPHAAEIALSEYIADYRSDD